MKSVLVLLCVAALGALAAELPQSEKDKLQQVHNSCQANPATYVDEDKLRKLSQYLDDPKAGAHMLCMSVKAGLQKQNGDFEAAVIKSKIGIFIKDQSQINALYNKCAVKKETPGKTASLLWICLNQNNVAYLHKL